MKILAVEDNAIYRALLKGILNMHDISECETGQCAIDSLEAKHFDLVLLDLNLPDMSGFDVMGYMRFNRDTTPVIIISGMTSTDEILQGRLAGALAYITKPFTKNELLHAVHRIEHE